MTIYGGIFYFLAALILITTILAVAGRDVLHSIVFLAISFIFTALLFYMLGAPFLAAMEVIIYAGAIMVLFLIVVMTIPGEAHKKGVRTYLRQWLPALFLGLIALVLAAAALLIEPGLEIPLQAGMFAPLDFGRFIYDKYWLAVEIVSFLLFVALVGGFYLGRRSRQPSPRGRGRGEGRE